MVVLPVCVINLFIILTTRITQMGQQSVDDMIGNRVVINPHAFVSHVFGMNQFLMSETMIASFDLSIYQMVRVTLRERRKPIAQQTQRQRRLSTFGHWVGLA